MRTVGLVCAGLCLLVNQGVLAAWKLDNDNSQLNFISTKNEHISEPHHFTSLSGTLSENGDLDVSVDLSSVETMIPIRNERMQEHLFEVEKYPVATLKTKLSSDIMSIPKGGVRQVQVSADVTISGETQSQLFELIVSRDNQGSFTATTVKPLIINSNFYNLTSGVDKLKELAMLNSISLSVPVTFSVTFVSS